MCLVWILLSNYDRIIPYFAQKVNLSTSMLKAARLPAWLKFSSAIPYIRSGTSRPNKSSARLSTTSAFSIKLNRAERAAGSAVEIGAFS